MTIENPIKSVGMKLFLIFFICIVVLVVAVGLFSYSQSKSIIENKMAVSTEQTISEAADKLELMLKNYESISMQFLTDNSFKATLRSYTEPTDNAYERLTRFKDLSDKLQSYLLGNSTIASISLLPLQESNDVKPVLAGSNFTNFDYLKTDWFKQGAESDGQVIWVDSKKTGFSEGMRESVFGLSRVLSDPLTGKKAFLLLFEIKLSSISDGLSKIKIGDTGQIVIVDVDNKLISSPDKEAVESKFAVPLVGVSADDANKAVSSVNTIEGDRKLIVNKKMAMSDWSIAAVAPVSELVQETSRIQTVTWVAVLVSMAVAGIAGFFVARMIGGPLVKLRNLMKEGEQGNLTVRMDYSSKDEIGQLSISFNQMMEQITRLVQQTNHSASEVLRTAGELLNASKKTAVSAKEIAVATEEIANGASSLAIEAEKGSSLTNEIGGQMRQVVESNMEMGSSAAVVQQESERGTTYMSELIVKTNATEEMTRSMVEKVDRLKESTSSIRKILDVLNNMTKQTNILSLNATIEAARAGAAGKGFMVVADEIRKLAEQSKQSIEVVGQITETIQTEIDETVSVLSTAYPVFQEQIQSVKEAEQIFKQVQGHMSGFVVQLESATQSIQLLDQSQLVLNEAMTNVSAVSEESSATSQEVASLSNEQLSVSEGLVRLSESLEDLSNSLQQSLDKFRV
ncbi:methyl-accepting chemotaxis protein [Paenibacillus sp. MBLB4367]|uniref:methyl-accepting chemotaxis protein n=1 Tax=Paenibacillus sp. MBLB4367 TaxID=3384767 RepID=UPI003908274A